MIEIAGGSWTIHTGSMITATTTASTSVTDDVTAADDQAVARLRTGEPLAFSYEIYGSGRARVTLSFNVDDGTFTEEELMMEVSGAEHRSRTTIDEARVRQLLMLRR